MTKETWEVSVEEDIGYVIAWISRDSRVDFKIYEIIGICEDGDVVYEDKDGVHVMEMSEAVVCFSGNVKFDGCSNWDLGDEMFHACTQKGLVSLGLILAVCWSIAAGEIKGFCGS